ncbi:LutB/LldF family L-lactate oxidation iron-sulfur protein [Alphaproteobacteria bacterium LSUCC0684]
METQSRHFKENVAAAILDDDLKGAMSKLTSALRPKRASAVAGLPEFDQLRDHGIAIRMHTLDHIDTYLAQFEDNVIANGGHVHWCADEDSARQTILDLCRQHDVRTVTKGKSMVTEELGLNTFLDSHGILPLETDLGEYIIQLRGEHPSHIIAPATHLQREQIAETFRQSHTHLDADRPMDTAESLTEEARQELREKYGAADAGITGANFMIAETGSTIIVTNEGNGDLTQTLARVHIVVASLEKIIPTMEDAGVLLRLLARSATGQDMSVYTTLSSGPRRPGDPDGPEAFHVVLVDNGRSGMIGGSEREMLRCIRCSACLNHCPVYAAIGGHAYGWVYSGPMGKVLTPSLTGLDQAPDLPNASSFCGKCEEVCPMRIPLPKLMRNLRTKQTEMKMTSMRQRVILALWSQLASRPALYRLVTGTVTRILARIAGKRGAFRWLPMTGGWTKMRDLPAPEGGGFFARYNASRKGDH